MDEQTVVTNVEPTNIETDNSQVLDQATPMDSNTTYNNLPAEQTNPIADNIAENIIEPEPHIDIDPNKDMLQNAVQNAIAIDSQNNLQNNAGQSMNNFLTNEYDYDHNEAGTYWVAGAINDVDTQMSFLNTLIREEMYDEMDLQKYYYDTTMATARAYAAQKKKETAYGFYRAAQEKAIAEAALTGWYMPAEGNYMLGQYVVAQNKLEDPNSTPEDKLKAERVTATTEQWFKANQIGTKGIKCLSMMQYEETVRHNTIMGELAKQANQIAAAGQAANQELQMAELRFRVEEMELQSGFNYSKDIGLDNEDFIGHDTSKPEYSRWQMLDGAKTVQEVMRDPYYYEAILGYRGSDWVKNTLGNDYESYRGMYDAVKNAELLDSEEYDASKLNGTTYKLKNKTIRNGTEKLTTTGNIKVVPMKNDNGKIEKRVFAETSKGQWKQLSWDNMESHLQATNGTDKTTYGGLELQNGHQLGEYVKRDEFIPESKVIKGVRVYDKVYNSKGERIFLTDYTGKSDAAWTDGWNGAIKDKNVIDKMNEYSEKGYVVEKGKYAKSTGLFNNQEKGVVMYNKKENKYIAITTDSNLGSQVTGKGPGTVTEIKSTDLVDIPDKPWEKMSSAEQSAVPAQATNIGGITEKTKNGEYGGTIESDYQVYAYKDGNDKTHYVQFGELGTDDMKVSTGELSGAKEISKKELIEKYNLGDSIKKFEQRQSEYQKNQNIKPETTKTKDFSSEKTDLPLGSISGGSTKSSSGTENTFSSKDPSYEAYVLRMNKEAPNAPMLTQKEWEEQKKNINSVKGGEE